MKKAEKIRKDGKEINPIEVFIVLEAYRAHVAERAKMGIVPEPLNAEQVASLIPAGVDQAAYVKASFLAAVAQGEASSPLISDERAVEILGTMLGGYNIEPLISALDNDKLADEAAGSLSHTLLMFDAFYDVKEKADAGNAYAKKVVQSWADAEWFTSRDEVAEKITVTVYMVPGETNTDDLSPAPDAWSRPDIPLHAFHYTH